METFSIDNLFSSDETAQADVLAKTASDVETRLADPLTPGCGRWFFAFRSFRFTTKAMVGQFGNKDGRILVDDFVRYYERLSQTVSIVLDDLDCVLNHSGVRVCIYDEGVQYLPPDVLSQYPERTFLVDPDTYDPGSIKNDRYNCIIFSADVQFNSVQSLMRFIYSLDNCFGLIGIDYPAAVAPGSYSYENESSSQYGTVVFQEENTPKDVHYYFGLMHTLHMIMSHNGYIPSDRCQNIIRLLMLHYTTFNNYTPSLRAYNWLCRRLRTDLSYGLLHHSIQKKTGEILQQTSEPQIDFYIKNKLDHCTMDVRKAMQINRHRCFFVTDDISITTTDRNIIDFDDLEKDPDGTLMRYFEENDWQITFSGSQLIVAEHRSGNADYFISVFRIGAMEFRNPFHNQSADWHAVRPSAITLSPTVVKETGFVVCTKLSDPDRAFDSHFRILQALISGDTVIEYEELRTSIRNWYSSKCLGMKDWMWK